MAIPVFNEAKLRADIVSVWGEHGAHVDLFDHLVRLSRQAIDPAEPGPIPPEWEPVDGSVIRDDSGGGDDDCMWVCKENHWVSTCHDLTLTVEAKWWRKFTLIADPRWGHRG